MIFEEEHDVSRVKEYAHACKARAINAENLKTYYESRLPAPKKGRRTLQEEELFSTNNSLIQKILDHEARLSAMIQPRRRLKQKQSVEESNHDDRGEQEANVGTESSGRITKQVEYSYSVKQKYSIRARRYGSVGGAQSMSRRLQVHAVGGYTVDLDIHNCCLTLVYQIVQKLSPDPALPEELGVVFDQVANNRAEFIASLGASDEVQTQRSRCGQVLGHEETKCPCCENQGSGATGYSLVRETDPHSPDRGRKTLRILDDAGSDEVMQNTEQVLLRLRVPAQRLCFIA